MEKMSRLLYLHGYGSSPQSTKARLFAARFAERGVNLEVPALGGLTVSEQLAVLDRLAGTEAVSLLGSSLGGYVAALYAAQHASVERLVLMAPAFGFAQRWAAQGGADVDWKLVEDALRHAAEPAFTQPALIFHGRADDVVPAELSRAFSRGRTNVTLHELDSDHQLHNVAGQICEAACAFLI